ncbi:MAG: HNH endonuclease [Myxococcales bacterium]|nr:HNH endonuclease [Myxococcales bacterium]
MSVGPEFKQRLEEVKSALSHLVPDVNFEEVMMECMRIALDVCSRRRRGAKVAPPALGSSGPELKKLQPPVRDGGAEREGREPSRYVPVEVRRQVWQRDGGRCAFVGAGGRRCNSRHQLEIHHLKPFAHGGEATPDNLILACKRHNSHCARLDFGEEYMARFQKTG